MQNIEQEALRLVRIKMQEKGWNATTLSKKMGLHFSTTTKMLQSNKIKLGRIAELSVLLEYNFLRILADQMELDNPPRYPEVKPEDHTVCQQRIRDLEVENATLLKVLGK